MAKKLDLGSDELKLIKPISFWKKKIDIAGKTLFTGLGKMGLKGASFDWAGVGEAALETISGAGLAKGPGEVGFLLIYRSFISSIFNLAEEYADLFGHKLDDVTFDKVSKEFETEFEKVKITIDNDFFNKPGEVAFLGELKGHLTKWLTGLSVLDKDAIMVSNRLRDFFVFALIENWRTTPEKYSLLKTYFDTPFIIASKEARGWQLYNQWLKKQINDRMFAEPFGVEKVYVPLRAY